MNYNYNDDYFKERAAFDLTYEKLRDVIDKPIDCEYSDAYTYIYAKWDYKPTWFDIVKAKWNRFLQH
jgi:hypothetical protein